MLEGQVGTGFTAAERRMLLQILAPLQRKTPAVSSPFGCPVLGQPRWVRPLYVGTVEAANTAMTACAIPSGRDSGHSDTALGRPAAGFTAGWTGRAFYASLGGCVAAARCVT